MSETREMILLTEALLDSDGFFVVPKDVTEIAAGEKVNYLSIKGSFE